MRLLLISLMVIFPISWVSLALFLGSELKDYLLKYSEIQTQTDLNHFKYIIKSEGGHDVSHLEPNEGGYSEGLDQAGKAIHSRSR